ncbi:hypothetical protein FACS1894130_09980 [Spirochaetia bacterium]|nr:hypothetical protein FACS1894130_09980 [Spirochaetia bacterium]
MSFSSYLETLPLNEITRYPGGLPRDAIPFTGYPRQHPSDKHKLILIHDPLGESPMALEFKVDDVVHVAETPQAVTETGETAPLVKLWVRKGAHGVLLEPFEVQDPIKFANKSRSSTTQDVQSRFLAD